MRLIITLIIALLGADYAVAKDKAVCILLSDTKKELSQGHIAPITLANGYNVIQGIVYYFGDSEGGLPSNRKTINKVNFSNDGKNLFLGVDNTLYAINAGEKNQVKWEKEFKFPIKGNAVMPDSRLAVLTIDNDLYVLDGKSGDLIWSYNNGIDEMVRMRSISPITAGEIVVVPFSSGELIAFNMNGKKLWSYKFPINLLETQFADVIAIEQFNDNILIAANDLITVALDVKSGNLLWSKPLEVKNMNGEIAITAQSEVIKINPVNGQTIWSTKLPIKGSKDIFYSRPIYSDKHGGYFVVSNKGIMFLVDQDGNIITVPKNQYPQSDAYFTTEGKGVYFCSNTL